MPQIMTISFGIYLFVSHLLPAMENMLATPSVLQCQNKVSNVHEATLAAINQNMHCRLASSLPKMLSTGTVRSTSAVS